MKSLNHIISALILLAFLPVAQAETIPEKKFTKINSPIFLLNGFINFSATSRNQNSAFEQKKLGNNLADNRLKNSQSFGNDSQFFFKSAVMTESRAKYGAVAKMEFNVNSDYRNENPNLDQAFLFTENSFGKFELGNYVAVNQKMKTGPASFARGAGGINGKYLENVNLPISTNSSANIKSPSFILLAQSPIGHGGYARSFYSGFGSNQNDYKSFNKSNFRALKDSSFDGVEDATKLSYYTPQIEGLQLGLSFAPNSADSGISSTKYYNVSALQVNNIISFGANYSEDFDNLGLAISATGEKGQTKNSKSVGGIERENLFSYDLATTLSYFGFSVGASYGSWGKSLQPKNGNSSCDYNSGASLASQNCQTNAKKFGDSYYYTGGISYVFGPIAASITALKSSFQKNNYQAFSLGVDYKLTKDLMPYFEVTKFTFKSNQPRASDLNQGASIADNQGYVFLSGILISF